MKRHGHRGHRIPYGGALRYPYLRQRHQPDYKQNPSHRKGMAGTSIRRSLCSSLYGCHPLSCPQWGRIVKRAVYIALGIGMEGKKDILGMYVGENESAKFWLCIMNGLKNRGVEDTLIACVDGLMGFPQAIEAAYPKTEIQQCVTAIPYQVLEPGRFGCCHVPCVHQQLF